MIKNTLYSYDYHQPEDYRFSLDSVFLSQKVAQLMADAPNLDHYQVLDLCSGCGVVGLELNFHLSVIKNIDFLEVQDIYRPYFMKNIAQVPAGGNFRFLSHNYADLTKAPMADEYKDKYDLIVSNPPYFFKGEGLMSPSEFKNRCRFFIDSDFKTLIESLLFVLKPKGKAYLLVRPGSHHGRDLFQEITFLTKGKSSTKIIDEVRGTNIVELIKEA